MDKSDPKNIIIKHYQTLRKLIIIINKDFETEAIHKLRVEYKKLRAFLRMISIEKPLQEKIKIPGMLKKAYAIAGSIRDLQLQQKSIAGITTAVTKETKSYLKMLRHQVGILQPQFRNIPLDKTIDKRIKKTEKLILEKIDTIVAGRFVGNNCAAIVSIITGKNFNDANMHAIRKHLKDIFYTIQKLESAGVEINFQSGEILNAEKKYFDELLEKFGNLQDKCTSIALLDKHWIQPLGKADTEILVQIKNVFIAERDAMKKSLIQMLTHEVGLHLEKFQNVNV